MHLVRKETIPLICFLGGLGLIIYHQAFPIGIWGIPIGICLMLLGGFLTYILHKEGFTRKRLSAGGLIFYTFLLLILDALIIVGLIIIFAALLSPPGISLFLFLVISGGILVALGYTGRKKLGM